MLDNDQKKDRPDLGAALIATNKKPPKATICQELLLLME